MQLYYIFVLVFSQIPTSTPSTQALLIPGLQSLLGMSSVPHGFDLANAQIITRRDMRLMGPTMLFRETVIIPELSDVLRRLMKQLQAVRFAFNQSQPRLTSRCLIDF